VAALDQAQVVIVGAMLSKQLAVLTQYIQDMVQLGGVIREALGTLAHGVVAVAVALDNKADMPRHQKMEDKVDTVE
jgi:Na+/glutamate symporter